MVAIYSSPQNINIYFMLTSIYLLFVSIYQLIFTRSLLDSEGNASELGNNLVAIPLALNAFGIILFIFMFITSILKMTCRTGKNREYVFTLIYSILAILYLSTSALPVNFNMITKSTSMDLNYLNFCYITNVAIIVLTVFGTVMYTCAICKNDQLDTVERRLNLFDEDSQFKGLVGSNVGKNVANTFGLKSANQIKEVCATNFLPGTLRERLADGEVEKDVCAAIGLNPNQSL